MKNIFVILIFTLSISMYGQDWKFDLEKSKKEAQKEQKQILLVFSGSDWCAPCIKLDREIWQSETFKKHSKQKLILLKVDFPKRKKNQLSEIQQSKNNALAEKYNANGYFPYVLLLDAKGKVLNQLGYKNLSPEDYIKAIYAK